MKHAKAPSILILTRYGAQGASSRVRLLSYRQWLSDSGFSIEIQSLLPDEYLRGLYRIGERRLLEVSRAFGRRLLYLLKSGRPGLVWLEKELWPYAPAGIETLMLSKVPYAIDIDDAIFETYTSHRWRIVRTLLGGKIDRLFRNANLVTAGNAYLANRAVAAGASWVEILPTVVNLDNYAVDDPRERDDFTVGWIGSPATQGFVRSVAGVLSRVVNGDRSRFVTIGAHYPERLFERHEQWEWKAETEARDIACFDVGIMPLVDAPFERGKCGYKLIQYMACGVPVIASPVGVNIEIVQHGENGFLADGDDEWARALTTLKGNPDLRRRMGATGRRLVERRYSIQATRGLVARWLMEVAAGGRAKRIDRKCAE